MKFLVDNCLSPEVAEALRRGGHDAVHVRDYELGHASDDEVLDRGVAEDRVLVSADTDFGGLLAARGSTVPSVILYRRQGRRRPVEQVVVLLTNLPAIQADLMAGAVVVIDNDRVRVRRLPVQPV